MQSTRIPACKQILNRQDAFYRAIN
jgi:hypothetical protein